MKVQNIMSRFPSCCTELDSVQKAAQIMKQYGVGAVPVVTDQSTQTLVGIVTDRDLCIRILAENPLLMGATVSDVMTWKPVTCRADDPVEVCELTMQHRQLRRLPVVDRQGALIGMVSLADVAIHDNAEHSHRLLRAMSRPRRAFVDEDLD